MSLVFLVQEIEKRKMSVLKDHPFQKIVQLICIQHVPHPKQHHGLFKDTIFYKDIPHSGQLQM
jgi:hypothetical protein